MKKFLLSFMTAGVALSMNAAAADYSSVWEKTVENALTETVFSGPMAVDANGNVVATGAYTEDFTLAGAQLEAIGQSAYIVKYDLSGNAQWAVGLTGAATISKVVMDAEGNIYAAGKFADEVIFNSTSGESITKMGMIVEGAPTEKQNAAFVAKYAPDGKILAVQSFVPELNTEIPDYLWYDYYDGAVSFAIDDIAVNDGKVYTATNYNGVTKIGDLTLSPGYANYSGFMAIDLSSLSVLSLSASDLNSDVAEIANVSFAGENGDFIENLSTAWNPAISIENGTLALGFACSGSIKFNGTAIDALESPLFVCAIINNGEVTSYTSVATSLAAADAENSFAMVSIQDGKVYAAGRIYTSQKVNDAEVETHELFVASMPLSDLNKISIVKADLTERDITYNHISSAAVLPNGEVYVNALGYYNSTTSADSGHSNGDFAQSAKSYLVSDAFTPAIPVPNAVGIAVAGEYAAFAQPVSTGLTFSLYDDKTVGGINDILSGDSNAPVQYFNLQGIPVANPASGQILIRRQGSSTTKLIIR